MYELIHNIFLVLLVVFSIASFAVAALIGSARYRLHGLIIREQKLNDKFVDRWFYTSVIIFGSILFIAELGDFVQFFIGRLAENDSSFWAIILIYVLVVLISIAYGCLLVLTDDIASRIRFYLLEREASSKIDEQVKKEADEEAERLERILQL